MSDTDLHVALMESGRMNLMHLPPGAISWLWDRPTKQIDAAESIAVAANAHGNPIVDASLLKADQNVLIVKCQGGETFRIYPDGGFSHEDTPMDIGGCSSVLQGMGQAECEMDDSGHQMSIGEDEGELDPDPAAARFRDGDYGDEPIEDESPMHKLAKGMGVQNLSLDEGDGFKPFELTTYRTDGDVWTTGYDDLKHAISLGKEETRGGEAVGFKVTAPTKNAFSEPEVYHQEGEIDEDSAGGLTGAASGGGMGTGTPYVGQMSMDADPELDNLVSAREIGEASIHMFRNGTDELLDDLSRALGLNENTLSYSSQDEANRIKLEAYDDATDSYQDVYINLTWDVESDEFDGQYQSSHGSANVERMDLATPVTVNGKVHNTMDGELAANILSTAGNYTKPSPMAVDYLAKYIAAEQSEHINIPQDRYTDLTR